MSSCAARRRARSPTDGSTLSWAAASASSAVAARWIVDESWHPRQRVGWEGDHLVLEIPYAQTRELIMEIPRHGSDVEVLDPPELRTAVRKALEDSLAHYDRGPTESPGAAD